MFGVIFVPDFALQATLRHEPELRESPVALIDGDETKAIIFQLSQSAHAAGVSAGMTTTQGLARCSKLRIRSRSRSQETAAADALLQCAFSCSPWVEATADGVCTFELRGAHRMEDSKLAKAVVEHLARLDLHARVGIAENPDLALLAAHHAEQFLIVVSSRAFLSELPIAALSPSANIAGILRRWGIHTLGEFTALPCEEVVARLGAEAQELWDRADGRSTRLLRLTTPPINYEERIEFEHEIETLEPLLFILRRFIEQLSARIAGAYRVPEELTLQLVCANAREHHRVFRIPSPTGNVDVLFRVLCTHLENLTTKSPIVALSLSAKPSLPQNQEFGLFETALRDPNHFFETLARLSAFLGVNRAGTPILDATHKPDSFHIVTPNFAVADQPPCDAQNNAEIPSFGLPLRRFRPPISAQVELSQRVPVWISSQEISGAICAARGPFQISGDWWDRQAWACEEWDAQLSSGQIYRLSHRRDGWFVEGAYD